MRKIDLTAALGAYCLLTIGACAHTPPQELLDARAAYNQASGGLAQSENPAQLHTAERSLQLAEQTFEEEGDSEHTRNRAYIAMRKAQLAEVQARTSQNERRLSELEQSMNEQKRAELQRLKSGYASEQQARMDAERRAAELARIATVKQEARGMVISLSGSVLFASGKSELLPSAQTKLSEVANALTQGQPEATIVVEGHTDSQGSESFNLDLSQRRAQAVRDFLAAHGVPPERIRAEGLGFSRPVANNKTAEGRANNRRVEIVVQPTGT